MQRIRAIDDPEQTEGTRRAVADAERRGAPDPRVAAVLARGNAGLAWMEEKLILKPAPELVDLIRRSQEIAAAEDETEKS